ncbi:hypothetical protein ACMFMF_008179 [Clarireedia jacksonii]
MAQVESWSAIDSFLIRNGLSQNDKTDCYEFIENNFPGSTIEVAGCQGYCSLTFFVGDDTIVQFRPLSQGLIGSSLLSRIELLSKQLPLRFRPTARKILKSIDVIGSLPWVLTHGDIVASNIIINAGTGNLVGFVDWAEGEPLPFGICLYGLEEILGEMTSTGFRYDKDASLLRKIFWTELISQIPELSQNRVMDTVMMARDLGVLLWHGFAFDDGAINRVVEEDRDIEEIRRLDVFLDIDASASSLASSSPSELMTEGPSALRDERLRPWCCDLRAGSPLVTSASF